MQPIRVRRVDEVVLRSGVTVPVPIRSLLVVRSPATPALGTQGQPAQQCCSRRPKNGLGRKRLITGAHIFGMRKEARHAEFLHGLDLRRQHLNPMHRASDVHARSHWCATDRRHTAMRTHHVHALDVEVSALVDRRAQHADHWRHEEVGQLERRATALRQQPRKQRA